jgi:hypothetical protein
MGDGPAKVAAAQQLRRHLHRCYQGSRPGHAATSTQAGVGLDINNDGYLDLFIGNENGPSQLFLNNGDGTFHRYCHAAGVDRVAFTKGAVAEDYDHDGYMDLYVSNYRGDNALYHNNHDGTFTDVARQAGVTGTGTVSRCGSSTTITTAGRTCW